jgi:AraC family transcriptional regulator
MERWIEGRWERGIKAPGFICISPCDSLQRSAWDRGATSTLFFADKSVLDRLARESGLAPEAQLRSPLAANDPLIRHSLASLVEHQLTHGSVPRLLFSSAGQHIAMHLLVHYSLSARPETAGGTMPAWRLKRAIDYIEAHLGDNFGLDELAAAVEMTPHYFCRAFRMTTGVPPYRYALNRRIERAKELLSTTARSVTEIAFELGFASNAHFSSSFRQAVGHPPSLYRRIAGSSH